MGDDTPTSAGTSGGSKPVEKDSAPGAAQDTPELPFRFETRLAVVMYGGVSLAIYINGVAQELLHLVRATAPERPDAPLHPRFTQLSPVEKVYREVSCRLGSRTPLAPAHDSIIRTRIVVDVLSGTSAGGLNGLFLAKALANGGDMEALKRLWIEEGDLGVLLNDERSLVGTPFPRRGRKPPESLLNSPRMYLKLLDALRAMNQGADQDPAEPLLADELDLFVTATDLTGLPLPMRIGNGLIYEQRHKTVFHFIGAARHATGGQVNDFVSANDAFLAFAGRCTSSFPLAFEPMRLEDIAVVPQGVPPLFGVEGAAERWQRFFADYVWRTGESGLTSEQLRQDFAGRSFGDGGYLDNKPFSHAISALQWRHADANIRRKLIYVEPSPEHPEETRRANPKPNAFENLLAAGSTLPRAETIREDLERVLERNRRIEHVLRATRFVPEDVHRAFGEQPPSAASGADYAELWLDDMVDLYGAAYGAYHRLKVAELTSELAEVVTRVAGLNEDSDDLQAVRMLMSAWRQDLYDTARPEAAAQVSRKARGLSRDQWLSENRLLLDFDLSYRLRRLFFLSDLAQGLAGLEPHSPAEAGGAHPQSPRYSQDRALEILAAAGFDEPQVRVCRENLRAFQAGLVSAIQTLSRMYLELRRAGRELRSRGGASPLAPVLSQLGITSEERHSVLAPARARDRVAKAREVLGFAPPGAQVGAEIAALRRKRPGLLLRASLRAQNRLAEAFREASDEFESVIPVAEELEKARPAPTDTAGLAGWIVARCLRFYYDRFEHYDLALFPMVYGAEVGELAEVQVVRVSPEDATGLVRERDEKTHELRIHKLAGTRLANFGAFLDPMWRRSDILWGRLDAAEILLGQLLPAPGSPAEAAVRDSLIGRAQVAILEEDLLPLGGELGRRVLVEAFLHTQSGFSDPLALTGMLTRLEPFYRDHPGLLQLLDRREVTLAHQQAFAGERDLAAGTAYRLGSRAVAIFGRILDGLSGPEGRIAKPIGRYLAFVGRAVWGFVELAAPESIGSMLFVNWIQLLYALELLLFLGGMVLGSLAARLLGQQLLIFTAGIHLVWATLNLRLRGDRRAWKKLILAAAIVLLVLAAVGSVTLPEFGTKVLRYLRPLIRHMGW